MNTHSNARALTDTHASIDDRAIVNLAARINASRHDFLVLVRRFDERAGWLRCGTTASTDDAVRAHARRELRMRRDEARGTITITVELSIETGELVDKALDRSMEASAASGPEFSEESWSAQRADALVQMAKAYLSGDLHGAAGRKHYVHAHHVVHWSAGGETSLVNLMLLCLKHHTLLHEGGFTIEKDYKDRWFFRRPDGIAVPACGYRPEDTLDDDVETVGEYFGGNASAEVLRASAEAPHPSAEQFSVNETSAEAWMVREPASEIYRCAGRFGTAVTVH